MANKDASFGLRPARMMNGSAFMNQQNRYRIASGDSTAIFQGDLVEALTAGVVARMAAGDGGFVLGVFNGCRYTDPPEVDGGGCILEGGKQTPLGGMCRCITQGGGTEGHHHAE